MYSEGTTIVFSVWDYSDSKTYAKMIVLIFSTRFLNITNSWYVNLILFGGPKFNVDKNRA